MTQILDKTNFTKLSNNQSFITISVNANDIHDTILSWLNRDYPMLEFCSNYDDTNIVVHFDSKKMIKNKYHHRTIVIDNCLFELKELFSAVEIAEYKLNNPEVVQDIDKKIKEKREQLLKSSLDSVYEKLLKSITPIFN